MISKEEYKKTLVRMWDSVREDDFKGKNDCSGVECNECPITSICVDYMENINNSYDIIEFVEKWGKEHPIETNGSRFLKNYPKEWVFGVDNKSGIVYVNLGENCVPFPKTWWESEVDDND